MDEIIKHGNEIRPGYYQSSMGDVFDIAHEYKLDFPLGNALKYILRAGRKDQEKAITCIRRAIEIREEHR